MNDVAITSAAATVHRELRRKLAERPRTHRRLDQLHGIRAGSVGVAGPAAFRLPAPSA